MIGFAGLSHLGLVSSIVAAAKGFSVAAFDPDSILCRDLADARLPISEPGLTELLTSNGSRLEISDNPSLLAQCAVVYVSADVPTDAAGRSDLSPVRNLISKAMSVAPSATIVLLSQVPPGFTRSVAEQSPTLSGHDRLFYQVETLIFGRAVERAMHPERIIVGSPNSSSKLPQAYAEFLESFRCPVLVMRYESAELAKISINVFLAASVSVTNTLAELCEAVGASWSEIVPALKLDSRIGKDAYLMPGLGIAGGNLERDLATVLSHAAGCKTDARVIQAFLDNSEHRSNWATRMARRALGEQGRDKTVAVWGIAYKPDTSSTKNSPALKFIRSLEAIRINVYDPQASIPAPNWGVTLMTSPLDACHGADLLAVMTPWREFSQVDVLSLKRVMKGRTVIDPFAAMDGKLLSKAGFSHLTLGEPPHV